MHCLMRQYTKSGRAWRTLCHACTTYVAKHLPTSEIHAYVTPEYARAHSVDVHAGEQGYGARRGPKVGATGAPLGTAAPDPVPVVV